MAGRGLRTPCLQNVRTGKTIRSNSRRTHLTFMSIFTGLNEVVMKDIINPATAGIGHAPSSPDHGGARPSFCNTDGPTSELKNCLLVAAGTIRISSTAVPHPVRACRQSGSSGHGTRVMRKYTPVSGCNVREYLSFKCDRNGNGAPYRGLSIELM